MTVVGFDFGTTNSLVSVVVGEEVFDLLDDNGLPTPSIVKYEGARTVVGREAKEALDTIGLGVHGNFVKSPKTMLGDETIDVGGVERSPIDVTKDVIEHVRDRALVSRNHDGNIAEIAEAVATIPVDMDGLRRAHLRDAYARAGIRVVQFVHEPFAALYGHFRPQLGTDFLRRYDRKNILVVDWGGGTLDLTLCRFQDGRAVQLQNSGTGDLGGDVLDDALRNRVLTQAGSISGDIDRERRRQLRHKCEQLKINLSVEESASLYIRGFDPVTGDPLEYEMSRAELEAEAKPFIDDAIGRIDALLDAARISDTQVALCLVTGGMSRMPAITARLREYFGPHRVQVSANSATLIAQGAAWIANDKRQLELAKNIEVRLARGSFYPLLKAGTPVPFDGQELPIQQFDLYCADPRAGRANFEFCTPRRPGSNAQKNDPRDEIGNVTLDVNDQAKPLMERLVMRMSLDSNGVLTATGHSELIRKPESVDIHDLEFGITLGALDLGSPASNDAADTLDEGATVEPGDLLVRSNIADKKDPAYVPGELLYTYNSTYFSTAKHPPQIQVDERLFYQPCAICKRAINDPLCKCGSN